jgi:hypothetical protein
VANACFHSVKNLSSHLIYENLKIKIYKTIILLVVLHGCEIWSFTLRKEVKGVCDKGCERVFGGNGRRLEKTA